MEPLILHALSTSEVVVSPMNRKIGILESFSESWISKELYGLKEDLTVVQTLMCLLEDISGLTVLITNMALAMELDLSTVFMKDLREFTEEVK
jgi:hypothetical protein